MRFLPLPIHLFIDFMLLRIESLPATLLHASSEVGQGPAPIVDDLVGAHEQAVHALFHLELDHVLVSMAFFTQSVSVLDVGDEVGGVDGVDDLQMSGLQ